MVGISVVALQVMTSQKKALSNRQVGHPAPWTRWACAWENNFLSYDIHECLTNTAVNKLINTSLEHLMAFNLET